MGRHRKNGEARAGGCARARCWGPADPEKTGKLGGFHPPPPPPPPAAPDPADIERRIAEAAAKAVAEAEDGMNDLLVCLGQVRQKRERGGGGGGLRSAVRPPTRCCVREREKRCV